MLIYKVVMDNKIHVCFWLLWTGPHGLALMDWPVVSASRMR